MNEYFVDRVIVTDAGCWEWSKFRSKGGYGYLTMRSRSLIPLKAHRLSYELHVGPIPDGMTVDHLCFNPPCVNPAHLRLLTHGENAANQREAYKTHCLRGHEFTSENTRTREQNGKRSCKTCHRDRVLRDYHARVAVVGLRGPARGERARRSSLTEQDVVAIRQRRSVGESASALAREHRVSRATVQDIVAGRTWRHVIDAIDAAVQRHPAGKAIPTNTDIRLGDETA